MNDPALVRRVLVVRGLRAFADGYVALLLPLYLLWLGMSPLEVGVVATGTLLGSAALTLAVGLQAWRFHERTLLLAAATLMMFTGAGVVGVAGFLPLLLVAVVGTLNVSSDDVSVFLPLEHSVLGSAVEPAGRTAVFARYSLVGALVAALGAATAGALPAAAAALDIDRGVALRAVFALYGLLGLASFLVYRGLPDRRLSGPGAPMTPLMASRPRVLALAALFGLDAFGGGLVVQSMLVLWLYTRFDITVTVAGQVFFCTGLLSATSFFFVARIVHRVGPLRTMLGSHALASVLLILMPLMPSAGGAIALLMLRATISSLDVPTRSAYVMSIVSPAERAAAASFTMVPRSLASAAGPLLAGWMLSQSSFGWPLVLAGCIKLAYDALLYARFRGIDGPPR